jgi:hypothetical protein
MCFPNVFESSGTLNRSYFTNASPVTRCHIAEHAIMIPAWYSAFIGSGISALSDSADLYMPINSAFQRESGLLVFLSSTVITHLLLDTSSAVDFMFWKPNADPCPKTSIRSIFL